MEFLISYYDENDNLCEEAEAVKGEANEYDDSGKFVASHIFRIIPEEDNTPKEP